MISERKMIRNQRNKVNFNFFSSLSFYTPTKNKINNYPQVHIIPEVGLSRQEVLFAFIYYFK